MTAFSNFVLAFMSIDIDRDHLNLSNSILLLYEKNITNQCNAAGMADGSMSQNPKLLQLMDLIFPLIFAEPSIHTAGEDGSPRSPTISATASKLQIPQFSQLQLITVSIITSVSHEINFCLM